MANTLWPICNKKIVTFQYAFELNKGISDKGYNQQYTTEIFKVTKQIPREHPVYRMVHFTKRNYRKYTKMTIHCTTSERSSEREREMIAQNI